MTVQMPEYLDTQDYPAIRDRFMLSAFLAEGVGGAGDLAVTQRASGANMSVDVAAGHGWVQGDDTARQGVYHTYNDAVENKTIAANSSGQPRVDRIVMLVRDSSVINLGGNLEGGAIEVVPGTPQAGASKTNAASWPALPPTAMELAVVEVANGAASIGNAAIVDRRPILGRNRSLTVPLLAGGAGTVWTNMPAALTEAFGIEVRTLEDLAAFTQARLVAAVLTAGAAGAELRAQYSTDGAAWNYLDHSTGPAANVGSTGVRASSWVALNAAARADVQLRLVGINGNGAADPSIRAAYVELR